MKPFRWTAGAILVFLWALLPVWAGPIHHGKVIHISDGDTLKIRTDDGRNLKIRLAEIDTPEKGQPYGTKAKKALAALVFNKQARVVEVAKDRYGRTVGRVYVGNLDVNAELVRQGYAWVYRKYAKDKSLYRWEEEARESRRGLWASDHPIPPWEWRRGKKTVKKDAIVCTMDAKQCPDGSWVSRKPPGCQFAPCPGEDQTSPGQFTCSSKLYCREMASCAEAMFYLRECGLVTLDSDKDGVPCEGLCR